MSELFDSLNFPSTGLTASQSSQPPTAKVYWHTSPSPALASNRIGTPNRLCEHGSPSIPPLCTQAFLGELRKVSSVAKPPESHRNAELDTPTSLKAAGKRRADGRTPNDAADGLSDEDEESAKPAKVLFLGEMDESSPESRRRRIMDAGHTGRIRQASTPSLDSLSSPPQAGNGGGSSTSSSRSERGKIEERIRSAHSHSLRDHSTSSVPSRRMLRRTRGGNKRHQPGWIAGLGVNGAESPLSVYSIPHTMINFGPSVDGHRAPHTARKLFEDLNAALDESCKAVRRRQTAENLTKELCAASQPCSAPAAAVQGEAAQQDVDMLNETRPPSDLTRTGFARSTSVPNRTDVSPGQQLAREDSAASTKQLLGGHRPFTATKSYNDVFACDQSDAADWQCQQQMKALASHVAESDRGPTIVEIPARPLSSRSNLPSRNQNKSNGSSHIDPPAKAIPAPVTPSTSIGDVESAKRSARLENRRKLGTRPPAAATLPHQTHASSQHGRTSDRVSCSPQRGSPSTCSEVVDLTMDDASQVPEVKLVASHISSPRKSTTPSPAKASSLHGAAQRSRSTASTGPTGPRTALGMGKIPSACLSQARQPGLPRSSQCIAASQRPKRAVTASSALSSNPQQQQQAAMPTRSKTSPSAPFRPPARTRLPAAVPAANTGSERRASAAVVVERTDCDIELLPAAPGAPQTRQQQQQPPAQRRAPHIGSDDSFGLSETDEAAFATLASELGY